MAIAATEAPKAPSLDQELSRLADVMDRFDRLIERCDGVHLKLTGNSTLPPSTKMNGSLDPGDVKRPTIATVRQMVDHLRRVVSQCEETIGSLDAAIG